MDRGTLIDSLLDEISEEKGDEIIIPKKTKIGEGALEKAYLICDLVRDHREQASEWYGLMVGRKDDIETVRDIFIGKQDSSAAHTAIDGAELGKVVEQIKEQRGGDWVVNGWIHSHANFGTFFSGTDTENMKTVLNSVYLNTRKKFMRPYSLVEGVRDFSFNSDKGELLVKGSLLTDPMIRMSLKDINTDGMKEEDLKKFLESLKIMQPAVVGWSYSIVVNDAREKLGHINYKREMPLENKKKTWDAKADVEVIEGDQYKLEIDKDLLRKEVEEKVEKPRPIFAFFKPNKKKKKASAGLDFEAMPELAGAADETAAVTGEKEKVKNAPAPTYAGAMNFVVTVAHEASRSYYPDERIIKLLYNSVISGSETLSQDYAEWLKERLSSFNPEHFSRARNAETFVYHLILDPAVGYAVLEYAKSDPLFAKMLSKLEDTDHIFSRENIISDYLWKSKTRKGDD